MQDSLQQIVSKIDSLDRTVLIISNNVQQYSDSLTVKLENLNSKTDSIANKQNESIKTIVEKIDALQPDLTHEFVYPVILSILAGFIFWFFFSWLPESLRKSKLRNKIEFEIYQVYTSIFSLFDRFFKHQEHSPSYYQSDIRSGNLSEERIEMALQNKCMNQFYFYEQNVKDHLMPIGREIWDITRKIDSLIDRIFNFSFYLKSEEILLLDEIRKKLHTYDVENYNKDPVSILGNRKLYPVNPSLSYMKQNLTELYKLFEKLQNLVFDFSSRDRNTYITKIQFLYYRGEYEKAIKHIKPVQKRYPKDKQFLDFYLILSYYKLGKISDAFELLKAQLENGIHLVSNRGFLEELNGHEKLEEFLKEYFDQSEITEYKEVVTREKLQKEAFEAKSKMLKEYYQSKSA